jgi:hypothetical protein
MIEVHAAFRVVHHRRHISIIDEDNGVSVTADIPYVISTLRATKLLRPNLRILLCDPHGVWHEICEYNGSYQFVALDASSEAEALAA